MLGEDAADSAWLTALAYSQQSQADSIVHIWSSLLPVLAKMWWRLQKLLAESWPLRLATLLGPHQVVARRAAEEFARLPACCVLN